MTPQWKKKKNGGRGIEWCDYTNNAVGGCKHACRWLMPDGNIAVCYAEELAENGFAKRAYKHGFAHHYWRPHMLKRITNLKTPSLIFCDSMSDLFGHWVPTEHTTAVLDTFAQASWHTGQVLTKNAPGLLKYKDIIPLNVWPGVSSPPDFMWGKQLGIGTKRAMLKRQLDILMDFHQHTTWMSIEPLSWDVAADLANYRKTNGRLPLKWAVIGAATDGRKKFQPEHDHVQSLLDLFSLLDIPVFFKGNLEWAFRREDFPVVPGYDHAVRARQANAKARGWTLNRYMENDAPRSIMYTHQGQLAL